MALNNILVGAGFIGVGALLIVSGIRKNKRCSGVVVGKITGVHEDVTTDDDGFNSYSYSPEFEYEVNGKVYHGSGSRAYSKRRKIRIGGNINVFYNPNKPEEHFTKGGGFILPFLGIMLIIVGAICIYSGLQLSRYEQHILFNSRYYTCRYRSAFNYGKGFDLHKMHCAD